MRDKRRGRERERKEEEGREEHTDLIERVLGCEIRRVSVGIESGSRREEGDSPSSA